MAEENPEFIDALAAGYNAIDFRQMAGDFLQKTDGTAFSALTGGTVSTSDLTVTQRGAGANMSVDVAAGVGYVRGTSVTNQGAYRVFNDAVVNKTISANATGSQRNDLVCARIRDNTHDASGSNDFTIFVVNGVSPSTDPAVPASSTPLARVRVPNGAASITTAMIDDLRNQLQLAGFGTISAAPQYLQWASSAQYGRKIQTGTSTWSAGGGDDHGDHYHMEVTFAVPFTTIHRVFISMSHATTSRGLHAILDKGTSHRGIDTAGFGYTVWREAAGTVGTTGLVNYWAEGT